MHTPIACQQAHDSTSHTVCLHHYTNTLVAQCFPRLHRLAPRRRPPLLLLTYLPKQLLIIVLLWCNRQVGLGIGTCIGTNSARVRQAQAAVLQCVPHSLARCFWCSRAGMATLQPSHRLQLEQLVSLWTQVPQLLSHTALQTHHRPCLLLLLLPVRQRGSLCAVLCS